VNLLVPEHGVSEPFRLRESQRSLELWTDVRFSDSAVEISHENDSGQLLDKRAILRFDVGELLLRNRLFVEPFDKVVECARRVGHVFRVRAGQFGKNSFRV
jgi:hypothetical protein